MLWHSGLHTLIHRVDVVCKCTYVHGQEFALVIQPVAIASFLHKPAPDLLQILHTVGSYRYTLVSSSGQRNSRQMMTNKYSRWTHLLDRS